jgi:hypothetical protein
MGNFMGHQPWWVDVTVVMLPIISIFVIYKAFGFKACVVCGHRAMKNLQQRGYCERCYRQKFAESVVLFQRAPAPTAPAVGSPPPRMRKKKTKSIRRKSAKKSR